TKGKSSINLGDSLDTARLFDESLRVREAAYQEFGTIQLLDAWSWTSWKAAYAADDLDMKRKHLAKTAELDEQLHKLQPTIRRVMHRWANVLRDLGVIEFDRGRLEEARQSRRKFVEVADKL